jgi:hypothetical protein
MKLVNNNAMKTLNKKLQSFRFHGNRLQRRYFPVHKFDLGIYAIFYNEAHIIKEWVQIHLKEGFDHIFLLNHGSTDNWQEKIKEFISSGFVTVKSLPDNSGSLDKLRVQHADEVLARCKWIIMQDLDEFTYSKCELTIKQLLHKLPHNVNQVVVPWRVFGSSGYLEQPENVINSFFRSEDLYKREQLSNEVRPWHVKSLVKCQYVEKLNVHIHDVIGDTILYDQNHTPIKGKFYIDNKLAKNLDQIKILQNHYIHQSWNFYAQKMKRKGYWLEQNKNTQSYTQERFEQEDKIICAVEDKTLYLKSIK